MVHGLFLVHCAVGDEWLRRGWICFSAFVHGGLGHPDNRSKWDSSATGIPGINHKPKDSKQSSCVLVALLSVVPVWYQSLSFLWLGHFGLGIWPGNWSDGIALAR